MKALFIIFLAQASLANWSLETGKTNHEIYKGSHCVAYTKVASVSTRRASFSLTKGQAVLEVIALEGTAQRLKQPFVQVVLKADRKIPKGAKFLLGKDRSGKSFRFDLVDVDGPATHSVFLGKIDERESLIQAIRELSSLQLSMKSKGKSYGTLTFSLKGSSRTVKSQFDDCALGFKNHKIIE